MSTLRYIENFFSPDKLIDICEDEFRPLAEAIAFNIQTKTTDSGSDVNSLGLPAETTGATASSLHTTVEDGSRGLMVSFVGRKGIANLDEGSSPSDIHEQVGSFDAFLQVIEKWADAKENRWMLEPGTIDVYGVAASLWDRGSVLYQQGGGTEQIKDLLPPVVERISEKITEVLDETIYRMLDKTIDL